MHIYRVTGKYPQDDEGYWIDYVEADNEAEAEISAKIQMALNTMGSRDESDLDKEAFDALLDEISDTMTIIDVHRVQATAYHHARLHDALRSLVHENDADDNFDCYTCGTVISGTGGEQDNMRCPNENCAMNKAHAVLDAIEAESMYVKLPTTPPSIVLDTTTGVVHGATFVLKKGNDYPDTICGVEAVPGEFCLILSGVTDMITCVTCRKLLGILDRGEG